MGNRTTRRCILAAVLAMLVQFSALVTVPDGIAGEHEMSRGQTIYVPAYSHIYHGNKETPLLLSVTLSIRNVDPESSITITEVNYHETQGELLRKYIDEPLTLGPLGSERYIVAQKDTTGGSGANFIVVWHADRPVNPPIVETVMIGTQSQLGISFTSRGQALRLHMIPADEQTPMPTGPTSVVEKLDDKEAVPQQ